MPNEYVRVCVLLYALRLEIGAILVAMESGEEPVDRATQSARTLIDQTLRSLHVGSTNRQRE